MESINCRMDKAKERISELEDRNFEIVQPDENKIKRMKRLKKAYIIYKIPSKETICELLVFQKENRSTDGAESLFKEVI